MKRFSIRDLVLLCAPLLLIAGAGWMFSQRKPPPAPRPLHLDFRVEKPTTLEVFKGVDAALVIKLKGDGAGNDLINCLDSDPFLELQSQGKTQRSWVRNGYSGVWMQVWKDQSNTFGAMRVAINSAALPPGELSFGLGLKLQPAMPVPPAVSALLPLRGKWPIDRSKIRPFDFKSLPRAPLIKLRSAKITSVGAFVFIKGECVFDLTGVAMDERTSVKYDFLDSGAYSSSGSVSGIGYTTASPTLSKVKSTQRVCEWSFYNSGTKKAKTIVCVKGLVSADERWPLAFEVESFDFNTAKVGQTLKFKTWLATPPKTTTPQSAGS